MLTGCGGATPNDNFEPIPNCADYHIRGDRYRRCASPSPSHPRFPPLGQSCIKTIRHQNQHHELPRQPIRRLLTDAEQPGNGPSRPKQMRDKTRSLSSAFRPWGRERWRQTSCRDFNGKLERLGQSQEGWPENVTTASMHISLERALNQLAGRDPRTFSEVIRRLGIDNAGLSDSDIAARATAILSEFLSGLHPVHIRPRPAGIIIRSPFPSQTVENPISILCPARCRRMNCGFILPT